MGVPGGGPEVGQEDVMHLGGLQLQETQVGEHMSGALQPGVLHLDVELHGGVDRDNVGNDGLQPL